VTADDILRLASSPPVARAAYGPAPQQFAELRRPQGSTMVPVIVVLHGGCWREYADTAYTAPLASALVREGWATWNVEYRAVHQPGGGWPGTMLDAGAGTDALRGAAAEHLLDLERVVAIGHSAGGQLALWAATRARTPVSSPLYQANPLPLRGVVSLAGIVDLQAFYEYGQDPCGDGLPRLMGGPAAAFPDRYAAASPAARLPIGVRHALLWGAQDRIVPRELFLDYERAARQAGDRVESITIDGIGHHEFGAPASAAYPVIVSAIRRLLDGANELG